MAEKSDKKQRQQKTGGQDFLDQMIDSTIGPLTGKVVDMAPDAWFRDDTKIGQIMKLARPMINIASFGIARMTNVSETFDSIRTRVAAALGDRIVDRMKRVKAGEPVKDEADTRQPEKQPAELKRTLAAIEKAMSSFLYFHSLLSEANRLAWNTELDELDEQSTRRLYLAFGSLNWKSLDRMAQKINSGQDASDFGTLFNTLRRMGMVLEEKPATTESSAPSRCIHDLLSLIQDDDTFQKMRNFVIWLTEQEGEIFSRAAAVMQGWSEDRFEQNCAYMVRISRHADRLKYLGILDAPDISEEITVAAKAWLDHAKEWFINWFDDLREQRRAGRKRDHDSGDAIATAGVNMVTVHFPADHWTIGIVTALKKAFIVPVPDGTKKEEVI
ncbi:hypothetical protein KKF61_05955 [Patescibacteria group bacterium]|nr:hypothetical protein [Patescibacteria group bacterium]